MCALRPQSAPIFVDKNFKIDFAIIRFFFALRAVEREASNASLPASLCNSAKMEINSSFKLTVKLFSKYSKIHYDLQFL